MMRKVVFGVVGAILAMSMGAAGAYYTAQVRVPDNMIRAGGVEFSTEPTSSAISIDAMGPGMTESRQLALINTGTLAADAIITPTKSAGITNLYNDLTCKVTCGTTVLYDGQLATLSTTPLRLAPAARADLRFDVGLPLTVESRPGDYVKITLNIDGEQAH